MEEAKFKYLLNKWLHESLSPAEVDEFLEALHSPIAERILDRAIIDDLQKRHAQVLSEEAEDGLTNTEQNLVSIDDQRNTKFYLRRNITRWVAAASIVTLLGLGFAWMNNHRGSGSITALTNSNIAKTETYIKVKNTSTELRQLMLPDSSVVSLKPNAEIHYAKDFQHKRDIILISGNALFEVRRDPSAPFTVNARAIKTTALGTAFWVECPSFESSVTVRLIHGKVSLASVEASFKMKEVILNPGQYCFINKDNGYVKVSGGKNSIPTLVKKTKQPDQRTVLWTNTEIKFNGAKLSNVLTQIEARYGVRIVAEKDVIQNIVLTGQIYSTDSLRPILKSICDMNKLEYEMRNDSIYLKRK